MTNDVQANTPPVEPSKVHKGPGLVGLMAATRKPGVESQISPLMEQIAQEIARELRTQQ